MVVGEKCWSVLFSVNRYMSVWISGRCSTPSRISRRAARVQWPRAARIRSEEHTSELQSQSNLVCRLLLEKKNNSLSNGTNSYGPDLTPHTQTRWPKSYQRGPIPQDCAAPKKPPMPSVLFIKERHTSRASH